MNWAGELHETNGHGDGIVRPAGHDLDRCVGHGWRELARPRISSRIRFKNFGTFLPSRMWVRCS